MLGTLSDKANPNLQEVLANMSTTHLAFGIHRVYLEIVCPATAALQLI